MIPSKAKRLKMLFHATRGAHSGQFAASRFPVSRLLLGGLDETGEALKQSLAVLVGGMLLETGWSIIKQVHI
jgi:hypothetical protein